VSWLSRCVTLESQLGLSGCCWCRRGADVKGFGVALKLTFAGNNQLTHISTYVFGVVVVGCILVQMVRRSHHQQLLVRQRRH